MRPSKKSKPGSAQVGHIPYRSPQSSLDRGFSLGFPAGPADFLRSLMGGEDPDKALTERQAYRSRTIAIRSLELLLSLWLSTQAIDVCRRFCPSPWGCWWQELPLA